MLVAATGLIFDSEEVKGGKVKKWKSEKAARALNPGGKLVSPRLAVSPFLAFRQAIVFAALSRSCSTPAAQKT